MRSQIKKAIIKAVLAKFGNVILPDFSVETPENTQHGDYASNIAMVLAKRLKRSPLEIAGILKDELQKNLGMKIEILPPGFINFFISQENICKNLKEIIKKKDKFGLFPKKKDSIIIEYSSPNIAKPMGVHHLRTTIIGQALVNIYNFMGWKVLAMSFPGDWGTQFGSLISAYKKWGDPKKLKQNPVKEMLNLYVRFSQMAEGNEDYTTEARKEFKKLESGDEENRKIWEWFRKESFKDFDKVYKKLGVKIPFVFPESFFEPHLKDIINEAVKKKIAQKGDDNSLIIKFKDNTPPILLQKSDGATLYATRDLAQMKYRAKNWSPSKIVMVVANQQTLYFEQIFRASEMLGYFKKNQLTHVKFGMVLDSSGKKFATREGKLIPLEEVLNEAVKRAHKVVTDLNPKLPQKEKNKISEIVGIGAIKFFDLSQNRLSDIQFDWNKMLNLKGASAPYVQYTYARIKSILRKSKIKPTNKFNADILKEEPEIDLMRHLLHFAETVEDSALRYEPNRIAEYLLKLSEKTNYFYEKSHILNSEEKIRSTRLGLITGVSEILKSGMKLLGIEVPERM
jgi:arginyl-tRNA synthetase